MPRRFAVLIKVVILPGLLIWGVVTLCRNNRPNVILITVDTLRADHLGVYGYARNTSPHLDQFAKEAIVFRQAFSHAPATRPALSSLLTSYYPHETKKMWSNVHTLQPQVITLAEILKANGYRTAAFVSNFVLRRGSGFEQGFETYDDDMKDRRPRPEAVHLDRVAPKTTQAAINWLDRHARQKFFLWVHYMDPHGPYTPPAPYHTMFVETSTQGLRTLPVNMTNTGKGGIPPYQLLGDHRDPDYYISQYDGEIRFFDEAFGTLIEKIRHLGLFDNSVILFTADHGEGMGEHEYYFHHQVLYNGLLHVPLFMRLPGKAAGLQEVTYAVAHIDVLPTILTLCSIKASQRFRGRNLLVPQQRAIFAESHGGESQYALMSGDLKLIVTQGARELYDLRKDPLETVNLVKPNMPKSLAARVAELQARLDAVRQRDALYRNNPLDEDGVEQGLAEPLRALGYLQ